MSNHIFSTSIYIFISTIWEIYTYFKCHLKREMKSTFKYIISTFYILDFEGNEKFVFYYGALACKQNITSKIYRILYLQAHAFNDPRRTAAVIMIYFCICKVFRCYNDSRLLRKRFVKLLNISPTAIHC